ncbi:hypothetical protein [Methylobacterium sp. ID0610]|uniref:hypothetical protein n=1 Tax=Methylobacterium carpenticola TaxID=3344827 RepID=UPI0036A4D7C4
MLRLPERDFQDDSQVTVIGRRILGGSSAAPIQLATEIAEAHHERRDGTGCPNGLAGAAQPGGR